MRTFFFRNNLTREENRETPRSTCDFYGMLYSRTPDMINFTSRLKGEISIKVKYFLDWKVTGSRKRETGDKDSLEEERRGGKGKIVEKRKGISRGKEGKNLRVLNIQFHFTHTGIIKHLWLLFKTKAASLFATFEQSCEMLLSALFRHSFVLWWRVIKFQLGQHVWGAMHFDYVRSVLYIGTRTYVRI